MRPFYLVTSDLRQPGAFVATSLRDAKRRLGLFVTTTGNRNEFVGYVTRADMYRDRNGAAGHLVAGTIDRVVNAYAGDDYPPSVRAVVQAHIDRVTR